jgi:putative hydrolases of HD superfamily
MSEIGEIKYLFKQKEIERSVQINNRFETVGEHIYGCLILSEYFLDKESLKHINKERVFQILLFHDILEIETGDVSTYDKTEDDQERERGFLDDVSNKIPVSMKPLFQSVNQEYEEQQTVEAKFCKAIDRLEPNIQLVDQRDWVLSKGITREKTDNIKLKCIEEFPDLLAVYNETNDIIFG